MRKLFLIVLIINFTINNLFIYAETVDGNCGIVNVDNHSFSVCVPKGWIRANQSSISHGLYTIFYPLESSWQNSSAAMYINWTAKDEVIQNIDDLVKFNIDRLKKNGNPNIKTRLIQKIKNVKNKEGQIWEFIGDRWGNYEWLCYFEEKHGISMSILSSRKKKDFESFQNDFIELSKSYFFITNYNDWNLSIIENCLKSNSEEKFKDRTNIHYIIKPNKDHLSWDNAACIAGQYNIGRGIKPWKLTFDLDLNTMRRIWIIESYFEFDLGRTLIIDAITGAQVSIKDENWMETP